MLSFAMGGFYGKLTTFVVNGTKVNEYERQACYL